MSTTPMATESPNPSLDLSTLVSALKVVLEPMASAYNSAVKDIKHDISDKHEENRESRHNLRDAVDARLAQVQSDILATRERVANLELKVQQAVGSDGTGGAIQSLRDGQTAQIAAIARTEASVTRVEATINEFLPTLRAIRAQSDGNESIKGKRDSLRDWAEMILKWGALMSAALYVLHKLH